VLGTSLVAGTLVTLIMICVGLALYAYFLANPHLLPAGQTMLSDADAVFPRFISVGMPTGFSGLVVAGLLAAAMSSLSSGINSSCSVITVDFIDQFRSRRQRQTETNHVKLAQYVSVLVGVVVVLLSFGGLLLLAAFVTFNPFNDRLLNTIRLTLFGISYGTELALAYARANGRAGAPATKLQEARP